MLYLENFFLQNEFSRCPRLRALGNWSMNSTLTDRKASVISAQFIFKPGTYDDEFHKLDAEIEAFVVTIPGFLGAEKWISFDGTTKNSMYYFETMDAMFELSRYDTHREAKGKYQNWYDGYQIVVSEIKKSYGDGAIETIAKA